MKSVAWIGVVGAGPETLRSAKRRQARQRAETTRLLSVGDVKRWFRAALVQPAVICGLITRGIRDRTVNTLSSSIRGSPKELTSLPSHQAALVALVCLSAYNQPLTQAPSMQGTWDNQDHSTESTVSPELFSPSCLNS